MAQFIQEIRNLEDTMPWPPEPTDLTQEQFQIPRKLDLLLDRLLQNKTGGFNSRNRIVKLSLAQDIVFAVTSGRIKTPKNVLLPTMVKSLTNNTEIINILNKLGHGISYTLLMESQTENAFKIVEQQADECLIIPVDAEKEAFTIYVADNIDRNEETLSGKLLSI